MCRVGMVEKGLYMDDRVDRVMQGLQVCAGWTVLCWVDRVVPVVQG